MWQSLRPRPAPEKPIKRRKHELERVVPHSTRIRGWHLASIRKIRERFPKLSEAAILRKLLKLGLMVYNETGVLPENEI